MVDYTPVKLLEFVRDGLVEQEHYGFFVRVTADGSVKKNGDDKGYPFYLRSCAKPLQASLIVDFGLIEFYNLTDEEIAICCASHAGEDIHVRIIKGLLDKIGLDASYLKCGLHKPISKTEQNKLIVSGESENVLQNNCSGKHVMMLAICKKMGWALNDYDDINHPLQQAIKNKIYELCETPPRPLRERTGGRGNVVYPITKDGCGVPIFSMPLKNMVKGYLNLFLDKKYSKIREAFVQNPYLIGGEDRLDTAIMEAAKQLNNSAAKQEFSVVGQAMPDKTTSLIAKVGAGGLCIVVNLQTREGLIVKIMDCDMKARAICLIEALRQLGWLSGEALENDLITAQNKKDILTLHGEKIGQANTTFNINPITL